MCVQDRGQLLRPREEPPKIPFMDIEGRGEFTDNGCQESSKIMSVFSLFRTAEPATGPRLQILRFMVPENDTVVEERTLEELRRTDQQ